MSCNGKLGYFNTPYTFYDFNIRYTIDQIVDEETYMKSYKNFLFFYKNISNHPLSTTRNGEYFTPLERVCSILDRLEEVYPDLYKDPSHTFLDPCCGLGQFQVLLFFRLLRNLVAKFDGDYQKCIDHILKNMIYVIDVNSGNINFLTTKVFIGLKHYKIADAIQTTGLFNNMQFTCVLFNPPFSVYHSNSSTTLYPDFCTIYLPRGKISCCIIPNIWICSSRLKYFIKWMKKQPIYSITEYISPSKYFKINIQLHGYIEEIITVYSNDLINIDTINNIKQGYNYTLIDNDTNNNNVLRTDFVSYNKNIDIYLHTNKFDKMLLKILKYIDKNGSILNIFYGTTYYDITTNDKRLHKSQEDGDILCHIATRRGMHNWINKDKLFNKVYKRTFKQKMKATDTDDLFVITAYTTPHDKDAFVKLYICKKGEVYNASYIGFKVNSMDEANSLISYLSTDLIQTLLLLRKQTISISKFQLYWIPLVPLDREWTNESVLKWFKIDKIPEEIL